MRLIYTILAITSLSTTAPAHQTMNTLLEEARTQLNIENLTPKKRIRLAEAYIEAHVSYNEFLEKNSEAREIEKARLTNKKNEPEAQLVSFKKEALQLRTLIQNKQYDIISNCTYLIILEAFNLSNLDKKNKTLFINAISQNFYAHLTVLLNFEPIKYTHFYNKENVLQNLIEEIDKHFSKIHIILNKTEKLKIDTLHESVILNTISQKLLTDSREESNFLRIANVLCTIKEFENLKRDLDLKLKNIYPDREITPQMFDELVRTKITEDIKKQQEKISSLREQIKDVSSEDLDLSIAEMEERIKIEDRLEDSKKSTSRPNILSILMTYKQEKQARAEAKLKEVGLPATAAKVEIPQTKPSDFIPICERKRRLEQMLPYARACHVDVDVDVDADTDTDADFEEVEVRGAQPAIAKVAEFAKAAEIPETSSAMKVAPRMPEIIEMLEDMVKRKATYHNKRVISAVENFGELTNLGGSKRLIIIQHAITGKNISGFIHERHGKNDTFAAATYETKLLIDLLERAGYWPWPYS